MTSELSFNDLRSQVLLDSLRQLLQRAIIGQSNVAFLQHQAQLLSQWIRIRQFELLDAHEAIEILNVASATTRFQTFKASLRNIKERNFFNVIEMYSLFFFSLFVCRELPLSRTRCRPKRCLSRAAL